MTLGNTSTDIAQLTGSVGGAIASPIAGAAIAGTGLMSAATATALVGGGVALVTLAVIAVLNRKGPRQKIAATKLVDELEPLLARNVEEYLAGPRTRESYAVALGNFDDAWRWLSSSDGLGSPELGNPGKVGIQDRQRGGKWDWFAMYRDPIEQNPPAAGSAIAADAGTLVAALTGGSSPSSSAGLWIGLALVAVAVLG